MGIANDYTPDVDDLTAPTIAHAAFRMADEIRLIKTRAKDTLTLLANQLNVITALTAQAKDSASYSAAKSEETYNYAVNAANSAAASASSYIQALAYAKDASSSYAKTNSIASAFSGALVGFDANSYDFGSIVDQTTYFNRDFGVL
jgi:hypothetical protein